MTLSQRIHGQIALVALLVGGLAFANWYFEAGKTVASLAAVGAMTAIWVVVGLMQRKRSFDRFTDAEFQFFRASVLVAGLMLAGALGVSLVGTLGGADDPLIQRGLGIGIGLALILTGNAMPKVLGHRTEARCPSERSEAMKRFAGWAFVIAGILYVIAWLALPLGLASTLSTGVVALALVAIVVRGAGLFRSKPA